MMTLISRCKEAAGTSELVDAIRNVDQTTGNHSNWIPPLGNQHLVEAGSSNESD
jgi:hypothetical protein